MSTKTDCSNPLYRIDSKTLSAKKLPNSFKIVNGGVFVSKYEIEDLVSLNLLDRRDVQNIRCGQCTGCRLFSSFTWAVRCMHELEYHEHSYFVTLTYDEVHLPTHEKKFLDQNFVTYDSSLCRKHLTDFIKRLREKERDLYNHIGLRVFYCGEYGSLNGRPHYHLILFGLSELKDLEFHFRDKQGHVHYKSPYLQFLWSEDLRITHDIPIPFGFVDVSDVTFDTCAYVARYVMKKVKGKSLADFMQVYDELDPELRPLIRDPEFIGMSRRPGIGHAWYRDHKDSIYTSDSVVYKKKFSVHVSKPPRYYDKLYDLEDPELFEEVKEKRKNLGLAKASTFTAQHSESTYSYVSKKGEVADGSELRRKVFADV